MKNNSIILICIFILLFTSNCELGELIFHDVDHLNYFTAGNPRWINENEFNIVLYADYYEYIPCKVFRINPYNNTCKEILYHDDILYNPQSIGEYYTIQSYESLFIYSNESGEMLKMENLGDYSFIDSNAKYIYGSTTSFLLGPTVNIIMKQNIGDTLCEMISMVDTIYHYNDGLCYVDFERERFIYRCDNTLYEIVLGDSDKIVFLTDEDLINYGLEDWSNVFVTKDVFDDSKLDLQFRGMTGGMYINLQIDNESERWTVTGEISEDSINRNVNGDFVSFDGLEVVVKNKAGEIFFKKTFNRDGE